MQVDLPVSFHPADVSGIDWMVRHGRSLALSVAVSVAPSRLCMGKYGGDVQDMILSNAMADRVRPCGGWTRWSEARISLASNLLCPGASAWSPWAPVSSSKQ